jgi:predicted MFS family arabinose efflux permease
MPAYLLHDYYLSPMQITYVFMGVGFFWSGANFLYSRLLSKSIPPKGVLSFTLITLGIFLYLFFFLVHQSLASFLAHYYFCVMLAAVSWSNCLANVSLQAGIEIQGRVLGINQSFASIAAITGPIAAGLIAGFSIKFVYLFSSLMAFLAMALLISQLARKT